MSLKAKLLSVFGFKSPVDAKIQSQFGYRFGLIHTGYGELSSQLGILYGEGSALSIHTGKGKPIKIKCLYNSYAMLRAKTPIQGTVKALYNSDVRLRCYLNLAEFDHRG